MKRGFVFLAVAATLALIPLDATAQDGGFDVTVQEDGRPVADADLSVVINGIKQPTDAATGSNGEVRVADAPGVDPGTPTRVFVRRCVDGTVEVVLVPEGQIPAGRTAEEVACASAGAVAGEDCECEEVVGTFAWGQDAVVDVGTGRIVQAEPRAAPGREPLDPTEWSFGADVYYSQWTNLEDTACDQPHIGGCEAEDGKIGGSLFGEWRPHGTWPIGLGTRISYTPGLRVDQTFTTGGDPTIPDAGLVEMDVFEAGLYTFFPLMISPRTALLGQIGLVWAWNNLTVTNAFRALGERVVDERDEGGLRLLGGIGIEHRITNRLSLRGEFRGVVGDEDDADTHWRTAAGVSFRPGTER